MLDLAQPNAAPIIECIFCVCKKAKQAWIALRARPVRSLGPSRTDDFQLAI